MKKQIRTIGLVVFFLFGWMSNISAQDLYDYAMVTYRFNDKILEVDINGEIYERIDVPKTERKTYYLASPALKQVKKMTDERWELFDTGTATYADSPIFLFYLKRKVE